MEVCRSWKPISAVLVGLFIRSGLSSSRMTVGPLVVLLGLLAWGVWVPVGLPTTDWPDPEGHWGGLTVGDPKLEVGYLTYVWFPSAEYPPCFSEPCSGPKVQDIVKTKHCPCVCPVQVNFALTGRPLKFEWSGPEIDSLALALWGEELPNLWEKSIVACFSCNLSQYHLSKSDFRL